MADTSFAIRLCEPADTPRIVPLLQAQVAASGIQAPDPDALEELVHALLINYRLSSWDVGPYAAIEDFYLAPELRGKGFGVRMLDYACARAESRGSRFVQAVSRPE